MVAPRGRQWKALHSRSRHLVLLRREREEIIASFRGAVGPVRLRGWQRPRGWPARLFWRAANHRGRGRPSPSTSEGPSLAGARARTPAPSVVNSYSKKRRSTFAVTCDSGSSTGTEQV